MSERHVLTRRIRMWLVVFIVCLVLSGLTAFPLLIVRRMIKRLEGLEQAPAPTAPVAANA